MKKRFKMLVAMMIVAVMGLGTAAVFAENSELPEGASTKTARFNVMGDMNAGGAEFSMISEDGELVIHIHADTPVNFEYELYRSDDPQDGKTSEVREMLFDQTLAEVLDGRELVVTYAITTRSIPPQTSPISVVVLFETAVHLPLEISPVIPPQLIWTSPFADVFIDEWFFTPVIWAFDNGIMNGISDTHFAPYGSMTRAMLVTVLWRYAGEPSASVAPTFGDVAAGTWYSDAVAWAAENGVVTGFSDTVFGPNEYINREQMYTILYRYMNFMGLTVELEEEMRLQRFADHDMVSDWAREALLFMFNAGIMYRDHDMDTYAWPQINAIRGEIAGAMFFFDMMTQ